MKKKLHIVLLLVLLSGCASLGDVANLIATPTPAVLADEATESPTETPFPTQNLFATSTPTPITFTPTPTQLGAELFTPTMTATGFPTLIDVPLDESDTGYLAPTNVGFLAVLISNGTMYWNAGPCTPRNIKISAFVDNIVATHRVFLFTRLREKKNTLNVTDWNAGALMIKADNGSFNYDIGTDNLRRYYYFKDAWLEYQLVAQNEDQEIVGRTKIYDRNLSLVRCTPIP